MNEELRQRIIEILVKPLKIPYQQDAAPGVFVYFTKAQWQALKGEETKQDKTQDRTKLHEWGSPKGLPKGWRGRILKGSKEDRPGLREELEKLFEGERLAQDEGSLIDQILVLMTSDGGGE